MAETPKGSTPAEIVKYLKEKNGITSASDQDTVAKLLSGAAELHSQGFQVPGQTVHGWFRENVKPVVDTVTGGIESGTRAIDQGRVKLWDTVGAGGTEAAKTVQGKLDDPDHYRKGAEFLNPIQGAETPEGAAVTAATLATGGIGKGLMKAVGRAGLVGGAGATTGALTEEGDPIKGTAEGLLSATLATLFRKGMAPSEAKQISETIKKDAPWLSRFLEKGTQDELMFVGKSDVGVRKALREDLAKIDNFINTRQVAGRPVSSFQLEWPGISKDVPLTPHQILAPMRGGQRVARREMLTFDQARERLLAMERGPERDAAEKGLIDTLNQFNSGGRPLGDYYQHGITQYAKAMDGHDLLNRVAKMTDKMTGLSEAGGVSVGPWYARLGGMFKSLEKPFTIDKMGRGLRQGKNFDPAYSPNVWRTPNLIGNNGVNFNPISSLAGNEVSQGITRMTED